MPKQTFFNLPEEKRQRIINIALEEFAKYNYNTASLSRIVEKAEIAKGSMYQYFENKKDFYLYIIDFISNAKLAYISEGIDKSVTDFFDMYKQMIFVAAKFDLSHPLYSRIMYNVGRENYNDEIGNIAAKLKQMSDKYIMEFVIKAQAGGQIRKDINADLIAFVISRMSMDIGEYITEKYNFSYEKIIEQGESKLPITDEELGNILDELNKIFKSGFRQI